MKMPTATRIHRFGLRTRSETDKVKRWLLRGKMADELSLLVYNPNAHITSAEDGYIAGTVKFVF